MPKQAPSQNAFGQMGGRYTRERQIGYSRNGNEMVQAFKNNPYTHSLHTSV